MIINFILWFKLNKAIYVIVIQFEYDDIIKESWCYLTTMSPLLAKY